MYGSTWAAAAKEPSFPSTKATAVFGQRKGESHILRQQQKMSSGLLRFSSAPSSFLDEVLEDFISPKPCSSEMESLFARFLAPNQKDEISDKSGEGGGFGGQRKRPFPPPPAGERDQLSSASSQMFYHLKHPKAENLNQVVSSMSMEAEQKRSNGAGANLLRQSSSPAGLLSNVNVNSGTGLMRGTAATIWSAIDADHGLKSQISLPSRQNPVSQLSEMRSEGMTGDERTPKKNINASCFAAPGYSVTSWEDSLLSNNITGDSFVLSQIELQDGAGLSHQFSFPTTTSEIDAIDKYLHYQDSIPCKTRAKRGCATHPRSIAERVRRTRISQRMRKLQELFPNMDKQTSTSDMLDLAVEYIKDLQRQVKLLSEEKAACRCSARK